MRRLFKSNVHICIVGAMVLWAGIYDLIEMIAGAFTGNFTLNFNALMIFIGLGLLRGSALQRRLLWGLMAIGFIGVIVGIFVFVLGILFFEFQYQREIGPVELGALMVILAIYLYWFLVLGGARNSPWFAEDNSGKAPDFIIPVTVVLSVLSSFGHLFDDYQRQSAYAELFPYDLDIEIVDQETGKPIKSASIGRSGGEFRDLDLPGFLTRKSSSSSGDPRVAMTIKGFAKGGFQVTVDAEGYEGTSVDVTKENESPLKVQLTPEKEAEK